MKVNILDDRSVLKTIELTNLQVKAIRLTGEQPEDYLVHKLERILEFAVNQAKQMINRISLLTDKEMENMIDEIEEENQDVPEES